MISTLLATTAFGADCPADIRLADWSATLGAAEDAYRTFDAEGFDDTLDNAALDLRCLSDRVLPDVAARYHVLSGLRMYIHARMGDATQEFASARAADPALVVNDGLVPPGHEVRSMIPLEVTGPTVEFPTPAEGVSVALDGTVAVSRPVDRPVIVQVLGAAGEVTATAYLLPGDPLPPYPLLPRPVPAPVAGVGVETPLPEPVPHEPRRPRWGVLGASGVAAGASVVLYALAARSEAKFNAQLPPEYGKDELVGLRKQTNGLVWGSIVAGSLAGGGMVVFVVAR